MRIWRAFVQGLRTLRHRADSDRETSEELNHFLDEAAADLIARGATPEEARRAVRLRYGDELAAMEEVRAFGWEARVETLLGDLRLSLRGLRRDPAFTAVVVLTLGLGLGATVAVTGAVRPVLFEPLGYPAADRIVTLADRGPDGGPLASAFGTYRELVERARTFESLAAFRSWQPTLTGFDEPLRLQGQAVTASYFEVLGVGPALGPGLDQVEDHPSGARQVVLSHALWRDRFDADPGLVGRTIRLDGAPTTVVGVMPGGFENVTAPQAALWTLLQYDPVLADFDTREWGRHLQLAGRLRLGVPIDEAQRELAAIAAGPIDAMPRPLWASLDGGFVLEPLKDAVVADVRPTMLVLLGAVLLLITVTAANLTILLLARGARRRGEFALRTALGAGRGRLARYLVTEGLLLAGFGGALGLAVASGGLAVLDSVAPPSLPRTGGVELDGFAVVLSLTVTLGAGVLFGLAPGLHRMRADAASIRASGRGPLRRGRATRRGLVIAEIAVTTVLLVGAGLLVRSARQLFAQPLGLDPSGVVVMQVFGTGLESGDRVTHDFFDQALEAVRAVPGVASASLSNQLPLSGDSDVFGVVPDEPDAVEGTRGAAERYAVTPGYLRTLGVPLVRGRTLEERDVADAPHVAVLSRSLARRLFPDREAIGQRVRVGAPELEPFTVVGVVEDVKHASLAEGPSESVYVASHQWHWADRVRWIVVRAESDAEALVPTLRRAIWSVGPDQPVVRAQSMQTMVTGSEARRRFVLLLLSAFALSAVLVSGVGLFGVLSGSVAERTHEMGVRTALGASREGIVAMVLRQGLAMTGVGLVIGIAIAAGASGMLRTMLFGVSTLDPVTYGSIALFLAVGAAAASAVPALRAGRADPVDALRSD